MPRRATDQPFAVEARQLMEEQELTFRDVAAQAEVDDGYLARVLTGVKQPSEDLVLRVALALDLPVDYFVEYRRAAVEEYLKSDPATVNSIYYRKVQPRLLGRQRN